MKLVRRKTKPLNEMADYSVIEKIMTGNTLLKRAIENSFSLIEDNISDPMDTQGIARALKQITVELINKEAQKRLSRR